MVIANYQVFRAELEIKFRSTLAHWLAEDSAELRLVGIFFLIRAFEEEDL